MKTKPTILPCPFCSGKAAVSPTIITWSEYRMETKGSTALLGDFRFGKTAVVECSGCRCSQSGRGKTDKAARRQAVKAWNTRA